MADPVSVDVYSGISDRDRSAFCRNQVTVQQLHRNAGNFADSGNGYAYSAVFDLRGVRSGDWSLLIIPTDLSTKYHLRAIYEVDANGSPDQTKAFIRVADAVVASPAFDTKSIAEAIPFLQVGFHAADTTSNDVQLILSAKG